MTPASLQSMRDPGQPVVLSLISVVLGGLGGWAAAFSGMNLCGLVVAALITVAMIVGLARRGVSRGTLGPMLALGSPSPCSRGRSCGWWSATTAT